jgi:hypothetical protein
MFKSKGNNYLWVVDFEDKTMEWMHNTILNNAIDAQGKQKKTYAIKIRDKCLRVYN